MPDFFHTRFGVVPSGTSAGLPVQVHKSALATALKNRGKKDSDTNLNGEQLIINLDNDGEYDFHITFQAIKGQQIWFDRAHFCIRKDGPQAEDRQYNAVIYWWYKFVIGNVVVPKNAYTPTKINAAAFNYSFMTPLAGEGLKSPEMIADVDVTANIAHPAFNTPQSGILDNLISDMKKPTVNNMLSYKKSTIYTGWQIGPG